MTVRTACLYSAQMIGDLSSLEQKLEHFLAVHEALRTENQDLRTRVAALEADKRRLEDKLNTACGRLEALLEKLPE